MSDWNGSNKDNDTREVCYRCFKPRVVCICETITQVSNRTEVLILQHKSEHMHPIGTVRIATLGLERVQMKVVWPDENRLFTCPSIAAPDAGLLFPGEDAADLSTLSEEERPGQLVVLDGSWADAKHLLRDNPWLQKLPRYSLSPTAPSRYRIRAEPTVDSISTIEAIVMSLQLLEPETRGLDTLIDAFDGMIEDQIGYLESRGQSEATRRKKRPRQKESRSIPGKMLDGKDRMIVAFGESVPHPGRGRALVSWIAFRMADGKLFQRFVQPPVDAEMTGDHLELMGLSEDNYRRAVDPQTLRKDWERFCRPGDLLVTWNRSTLDLFNGLLGGRQEGHFLKAVYTNVIDGKCGHLHQVVERENLIPEPVSLEGRAATRLGEMVAVVRFLLG